VVTIGPYITVRFMELAQAEGYILEDQLKNFTLIAMLLWSPLFFSIPALIQQDARDRYYQSAEGVINKVVRAVYMPVYLATNKETRTIAILSYLGLAVGLSVIL
jgi:hypothetical protein